MSGAPLLTRHDVVEQLERLYGKERKRHLVAFFGTGTEEAVSTANAGQFMVVPVRSELELRERMPPLEKEDARVAFLVPWSTEIPLDLSGRFANGGRILRVGLEARFKTLLKVTNEVDDDAWKGPLATYLLATSQALALHVPAGRLTTATLWNAWLQAAWGVEVAGGVGLDTLLGWAATDGKGPKFVASMGEPQAAGVRDALLAYLRAQLGPAGEVIWKAWESGRGRTVLEYALLFETLATSEHAGVRMWVKVAPRAALGVQQEAEMWAVAKALGASADGALRYVKRRADSMARGIVRSADALVENLDVRAALAGDRRLPSAWRARIDSLGAALTALATAPSPENVGIAATALRALERHAFFTDADQTALIRRAEMAVRLGAWLAARPDRELQGAPTPLADAELLGRWYTSEGGYVDWARKAARGTDSDAFGKGAQAIVAAADGARGELDHRFARSLRSWIEAGRPSSQVVPIDEAVKRVAIPFLDEDPSRRLLVLLLDGMAWAQAVEILQSLGARTLPWGPLKWHGSSKGKIGQGIYPTVFANLPTVTDVSRAAFFGGKALPPGAAWSTAKDPDRWAENREVGKFLDGNRVPRLLLRGEGHTQGGAASPEALSLVSDKTQRIVAIVINAIDASLKADPQQRHLWTVESIQSLPELLERARAAGRAVLLASDHGHVPADCLVSQGSFEKAGARWRPWASAEEALGPHELGFRASTVWSPKGAHGVALLIDEASRYGGAAHAGEHGGATLAEVVAPCLLVGCEDLGATAHDDRGLDVAAAHVPAWWHFDVRPRVTVPDDVPAAAAPTRPKKSVNVNQLPLLPPEPEPPAPKASAFGASSVLGSLGKPVNERRQIILAVEFLLERQGVASDAAFAAALAVPTYRIGGVVAKLQEALNIDGYQVLRYDFSAKTIHLDREKLAQQFEVVL